MARNNQMNAQLMMVSQLLLGMVSEHLINGMYGVIRTLELYPLYTGDVDAPFSNQEVLEITRVYNTVPAKTRSRVLIENGNKIAAHVPTHSLGYYSNLVVAINKGIDIVTTFDWYDGVGCCQYRDCEQRIRVINGDIVSSTCDRCGGTMSIHDNSTLVDGWMDINENVDDVKLHIFVVYGYTPVIGYAGGDKDLLTSVRSSFNL